MRTRVATRVVADVEVRRVDAIHGVLVFVLEVLRLERAKPLIDKGVRQNRWITRLRIVSQDEEETIHQELVFSIDWDRHEVYLSQGQESIALPGGNGLVASISPELTTQLRLFNEHRLRHGLRLDYFVTHRTDDPSVDVGQELGLGSSVTLRYAGDRLEIPFSTGELGELGAAYNRYGASEPARKPPATTHGTVVHVGDHYGFLRPDGPQEGRDYWFLLKSWPNGRCRVGATADFLSDLDHRGRRVASSIRPDGACGQNRW